VASAVLPDFLQLLLQLSNTSPDFTSVSFELGLTWTAQANATSHASSASACLSCQVRPHTGEPRKTVLILGQFYLQLTFAGVGVLGEDVKDKGSTIHNLTIEGAFQLALLPRRQLVIKQKNVNI
jgi:hypothetical protein